jgi:hypothetical protein
MGRSWGSSCMLASGRLSDVHSSVRTGRRRPEMVRGARIVWFVALCLLLCGCAATTERWPPAATEPRHRIYVSLDTWHGMIAYSVDSDHSSSRLSQAPPGSEVSTQRSIPLYEEWGYAERGWYLEGRQGAGGLLRALLWPSAGTVEHGWQATLWASRTPNPPADLFVFDLSEAGFARLRSHLRGTIAESDALAFVGGFHFYPSVRSYHVFHHCHHYVARALAEAGLPVSPFGALTRTTLAWQLQRAERSARDPHPQVSGHQGE